MKSKLLISIILTIGLFGFFFNNSAFAVNNDADFIIDTNNEFSYTTGNTFLTVKTTYSRSVENSSYYFPAEGEKIFHIPDVDISSEGIIKEERAFKLSSITVTDTKGAPLDYEVQELEYTEGIYIKVSNYKSTTKSSPYKIVLTYNTHDYVIKSGNYITLIGTSLPEDVQFEDRNTEDDTLTLYNYYFSIVTDKNIPPLAKIFPDFTKEETDENVYYKFTQTDRINNSPMLEFGTNVTYKFDLKYTTPQTDFKTPTKYSDIYQAISTNIYELSLPREFSETNQQVFFESVSPSPTNIYKDSEGNILATFEVPANQQSEISITGYILDNQKEYSAENTFSTLDINYSEYLDKIKGSEYTKKYLTSTKYWESSDQYIIGIANDLIKDQSSLLEIIKADYQYVNEILDYDENKANSTNERIGAVNALKGGGSVCMEYADSMIAILRAQGIPARAALGYANITNVQKEQIRHQWVQVWIPDYGWLSIDPTYESENMKIGQMIDRVLWETFNDESLSNIRIYSADKLESLTNEGFSLKIYSISDTLNTTELSTYDDLISKNNQTIDENSKYSISNWFYTFLKTTVIGRALLITIPVVISIFVITIIILAIKTLIKKTKSNKNKVTIQRFN